MGRWTESIPVTEYMRLVPIFEQLKLATEQAQEYSQPTRRRTKRRSSISAGWRTQRTILTHGNAAQVWVTLKYLPVLHGRLLPHVSPLVAQELPRAWPTTRAESANAQREAGRTLKELDRMASQLGKLVSGEPTRLTTRW